MTKQKIAISTNDFNDMLDIIGWRLKDVAEAMGYDMDTKNGASAGYSYLRRLRANDDAKIDREKLKQLVKRVRKEIRTSDDEERKAALEEYRYLGATIEKIALRKPNHRKYNIRLDPAMLTALRAMNVMTQEEIAYVMKYSSASKISSVENGGGKFPPYRVKALAEHLGIDYEKFLKLMQSA